MNFNSPLFSLERAVFLRIVEQLDLKSRRKLAQSCHRFRKWLMHPSETDCGYVDLRPSVDVELSIEDGRGVEIFVVFKTAKLPFTLFASPNTLVTDSEEEDRLSKRNSEACSTSSHLIDSVLNKHLTADSEVHRVSTNLTEQTPENNTKIPKQSENTTIEREASANTNAPQFDNDNTKMCKVERSDAPDEVRGSTTKDRVGADEVASTERPYDMPPHLYCSSTYVPRLSLLPSFSDLKAVFYDSSLNLKEGIRVYSRRDIIDFFLEMNSFVGVKEYKLTLNAPEYVASVLFVCDLLSETFPETLLTLLKFLPRTDADMKLLLQYFLDNWHAKIDIKSSVYCNIPTIKRDLSRLQKCISDICTTLLSPPVVHTVKMTYQDDQEDYITITKSTDKKKKEIWIHCLE